jgi:hypothetical protein
MLCFVCFWGSDAPPYEQNEACPFPPVNIFLKYFSPTLQSDEAQRLNVHFFAPPPPNGAPKREREQVNHGERDGYHPPPPYSFPYRPPLPFPSLSPGAHY